MRIGVVRRRKALLVVAAGASTAIGLMVACSFPDVTFAPSSVTPEGSTPDVGTDAFVLIDGSDPDALIVRDAGQAIDSSACQPSDCDCDKDDYKSAAKAGCVDAGVDAGPLDCNDFDSRYHPGQKFVPYKPTPPGTADWNCNNQVERLYESTVDCSKVAPGATCDGTFGFEDNPGCGDTGTFVKCKTSGGIGPVLATCIVDSRTLGETQACK
jgi:hypothetical protein